MYGKFYFGGQGNKIPGTDFGISISTFKVWLQPTGMPWSGYTAASHQGLLGSAIIETPIVEFVMRDMEDEEPFRSLHGTSLEVTISSTPFVKDGGIATLKMKRLSNDAGASAKELTFHSDECKGYAASIGDIHFTATMFMLPSNEQDPTGVAHIPW